MARRSGVLLLALPSLLVASSASAAEPTKAECIAANESAQDLRGSGKLLEARVQLATCMAQSCPGAIRQDCVQRLGDVEKALPTLIVIAKDSAGNDVGGVHATVDGKAVTQELNGTAMPLDPGEHRVVLEAAGLPRAEKTLVLHEGEKARREVVVFPAASGVPASGGAAPGGVPAESGGNESAGHEASGVEAPPPPPAPADAVHPGHTQRMVGVALGGLGLVGLVVGSIFGIVAESTFSDSKNKCGGDVMSCHGPSAADGASANHSAYDQATIATVGFVAGGVLLAGGAAVYFTAPRAGEVAIAPSVGDRSAGLTMRGAW
ncbi:MAG: hypothetical protein ACRENE_24385 [Polyangiaceae bacterium]